MLFTAQSTPESIQNALDALHEVQTEAEAQARKSKEMAGTCAGRKGE